MRISDWSSDVCSSDLDGIGTAVIVRLGLRHLRGHHCRRDVELRRRRRQRVVRARQTHARVLLQAVRRRGVPLRLQAFELLGAEPGLQRLDALEDRWMRGEQAARSEEHTSELQSLMRISYAVFCLQKKTK